MSNSTNAKKLCVFCGNLPDEKSKEHVLPQWLLELTGDPNRQAHFGADLPHYFKTKEIRQRKYAFSSFHFPACLSCNNYFGKLEGRAKHAMLQVLANGYLSNEELTDLLDWFDKVRTGLWLAFNRLDDLSSIAPPKFHITTRQTLKDRLLFIYDLPNSGRKQLTLTGINSPIFYQMPSCFTMIVNNKLFLNASTDFLVAESLGFAHGKLVRLEETSFNQFFDSYTGTNQAVYPVIQFPYALGVIEIYQAIFSNRAVVESDPTSLAALMHNEYLRDHLLTSRSDTNTQVSRIFYKEHAPNGIEVLAEEDELYMQADAVQSQPMADNIMRRAVSEIQVFLWLSRFNPSEGLTEKQQELIPRVVQTVLTSQELFARARS